jgi:uncharacterized protein (DUF1499 family)
MMFRELPSFVFGVVAILALLSHTANGFMTSNLPIVQPDTAIQMSSQNNHAVTKQTLITTAAAATIFFLSSIGANPTPAFADDAPATRNPYSIEKCSVSSKVPCVSTSNVRQLDLYVAPWTYTVSADEIMSRLKGVIISLDESNNKIVEQDTNQHLVVEVSRPNDLFGTKDTIEFVINDVDKVVTFRSIASNEAADFGLQRRRLDDVRKKTGVFGIMGDSMNTADSVSTQERGNGPIGQLKAFYGLQSGSGYEDVLAE